MKTIFYFGAMHHSGHYLHSNPPPQNGAERGALLDLERDNPWGLNIDTRLCPPGKQTEGSALLHYKDKWTALSFWDCSVDTRGGSCSTFLARGTYNFDEMIAMAKETWPEVMGRFKFEIIQAASVTPIK